MTNFRRTVTRIACALLALGLLATAAAQVELRITWYDDGNEGAVLRDLEPGTTPIPYTQNGATDSRSFTSLTPAVYRFTPFHLTSGERGGLHAVGERIRVSSWLAGVAFYRELIARL